MQYLTRQAVGLAREVELYFLDSVGRIETVAQALRPGSGRSSCRPTAASEVLDEMVRENRHIVLLRVLDASGKGSFVQNRALAATPESELEPVLARGVRGQPPGPAGAARPAAASPARRRWSSCRSR